MKKILLLLIILVVTSNAQSFKLGEAKGMFLDVATGPKIPLGSFAKTHNPGIGFDVALSYTDNAVMPVFLFAKIGYQNNPGKASFYQTSDYSSLSTNMVLASAGIRYYFKPVFENVVILMPVLEAGVTYGIAETSNCFKSGTGKENYYSKNSSLGFQAAGGISMFMLDVMFTYTYLKNYQTISAELKIRLPVFVKM